MINENELVSIIMPSFNTERFITESINSVINQSYTNWELIIIDDCSTDNTEELIKNYINDERIKFFKNDKNQGAAYSRNRALKLAKGKWIAFLDSDDLWSKDKLEKQISFMLDNDYYFSYTNYMEIDEKGNSNGKLISGPKKITRQGMINFCWPGCLTVMFDQSKYGLLQIENIKKNNDYAMWLKVSKKFNCYLLNEPLAYYRRGRTGSISTSSYKELIKWHYKLFRDAEHLGAIRSFINTIRNLVFGFYKKIHYVKNIKRGD